MIRSRVSSIQSVSQAQNWPMPRLRSLHDGLQNWLKDRAGGCSWMLLLQFVRSVKAAQAPHLGSQHHGDVLLLLGRHLGRIQVLSLKRERVTSMASTQACWSLDPSQDKKPQEQCLKKRKALAAGIAVRLWAPYVS